MRRRTFQPKSGALQIGFVRESSASTKVLWLRRPHHSVARRSRDMAAKGSRRPAAAVSDGHRQPPCCGGNRCPLPRWPRTRRSAPRRPRQRPLRRPTFARELRGALRRGARTAFARSRPMTALITTSPGRRWADQNARCRRGIEIDGQPARARLRPTRVARGRNGIAQRIEPTDREPGGERTTEKAAGARVTILTASGACWPAGTRPPGRWRSRRRPVPSRRWTGGARSPA